MLELVSSYSFSNVPYIEYDALDAYATAIVGDYCPENLLAPAPLDIEVMLEFYLHLNVEYRQLGYERTVLGLTAFSSGFVQVIDEQTGKPEPFFVKSGTVIIENSLLEKRNMTRLRFTLGHEASHWILHKKAFSAENPFFSNAEYENQYLAAKEGRIDYSRKQQERTDSERMERQADFFAAALLMPRPTLRMAFVEFFSYYKEKPRRIIRGKTQLDDNYAKLLPRYIAKEFKVSEQAAQIRLEKLSAIVDNRKRGYFA